MPHVQAHTQLCVGFSCSEECLGERAESNTYPRQLTGGGGGKEDLVLHLGLSTTRIKQQAPLQKSSGVVAKAMIAAMLCCPVQALPREQPGSDCSIAIQQNQSTDKRHFPPSLPGGKKKKKRDFLG